MTHDPELDYWQQYWAHHHRGGPGSGPRGGPSGHTEWMNECVPDAEAAGFDEDQAIAICLHIFDAQEKPGRDEAHDDFIERCVEMHEGGSVSEDDAIKICETLWNKGLPRPYSRAFDPNEPRDEHGRWTEGGASEDEGKDKDEEPKIPPENFTPAHADMVTKAAFAVANDLDFDLDNLHISKQKEGDEFKLNGRKAYAAGVTQGQKVTLFPPYIHDQKDAEGVTAHEIQHAKFNNALKRMNEDRDKAERQEALDSKGNVRPLYKGNFPAYEILKPTLIDHEPHEFAMGDGASMYSYENWQQAVDDKTLQNFQTAIHETLAEMSRVKYQTGKFPEHLGKPKDAKIWRDLYRAVDKVNNL